MREERSCDAVLQTDTSPGQLTARQLLSGEAQSIFSFSFHSTVLFLLLDSQKHLNLCIVITLKQ